MKTGTKSLLFGVHQFLWHPYVVGKAWKMLYGKWPDRYEWVAIITHDLGYWGLPNVDGPEGIRHPERSMKLAQFAAKWMCKLTWANHFKAAPRDAVVDRMIRTGILVRHHSRSMVELDNQNPLFRARLSGELAANSPFINVIGGGTFPSGVSDEIRNSASSPERRARKMLPSRLCWPDKFSFAFENEGFYLLRARLSGELAEFRGRAIREGKLPPGSSDSQWFRGYRAEVCRIPEIQWVLSV